MHGKIWEMGALRVNHRATYILVRGAARKIDAMDSEKNVHLTNTLSITIKLTANLDFFRSYWQLQN